MRRKFRRTLAAVMAAALTVSLMGTADAEAAKKIKLSKKSITVTKGKTKTVTVKNVKAKKVKKLTVKSSKKKIATVKKSGKTKIKVKGKKAGSAKVTVKVTLKGKKKATKLTLKVKVKNAKKKTTTTPPAAPATAAPTAPGGQGGAQPGGPATDTPGGKQTQQPGGDSTKEPGGDPTPTKGPQGTPTANPWDNYEKPDPAANVTLTYNDQVKSEENPNGGKLETYGKFNFKDGEGYPEGGIDVMKYDRVIIRIAASEEIVGTSEWVGKVALTSSDGEATDYTGLGATDDGFHTADGADTKVKYLNDIGLKDGVYEAVYKIPDSIDKETWSPEEISQYCDAINLQLADSEEYAKLTLKEIAFESDKQPQESGKPDESAKPSGAPDESAKPSGNPDESAKPSGAPDESAKPSGAPDESAKPSGAPDESAKPSGAPGESDKPSPTPLAPGEKEIEGVVCKTYELEAAKDYTITSVKADGSKEITELPLTELPNLLNKITDVAGTYEKWMDTLEYTKTVNGVTFEVMTADEDLSGKKQITVSGSTNARLNGEFEVSVTKNGAVYEAAVTKKGSTAEPTKLTITDGSDAVVVTGKYNGTNYRMTTAKDQSGIKVYTDDTKLFAQIVKTDAGYEMDVKKEEVEKRGLSVAPSTKKDPQKPTPTPTPVVPTPAPEGKLDLSKEDVCKADGDGVVAQFNGESGCLDITLPDFQAVVFKAPDNGKVYKYVKITYTGEANTVETFDENMTDGMTQNAAGKHSAAALTSGSEEKSVVYEASADHAGGCLKGIKFANVYSGKSVDLHIKSIEFSETAFPAVQVSAQLALAPEAVIAGGKANAAATVEITGTDAEPNITWTSSDDEVATVTADANDPKKAVVTSVGAGTAEITVTVAVDGKTATAKKTITVGEKLSITGEGTVKCDKTPVGVGDEATLSVDGLVIMGAKTTTITWAIDEECKDLATIDAATGKITGVAAGTVKVTATIAVTGALDQNDKKTVSGEIAVSAAPQLTIEATVTLTNNAIVAEGTTAASATVTVTGSDDEQIITWSSSNEAVATVAAAEANSKSAVVTGVAAGTAEIRVTVKVGETEKTFKTDIEVKAKLTIAVKGGITVPEGPLYVGRTTKLEVPETAITITNGKLSKIEWSVAEADASKAEISKNTGVLVAKRAGTVGVTAKVIATGELEQTKEATIDGMVTIQAAPAGLLNLSEANEDVYCGDNGGAAVFNKETGCLDMSAGQHQAIIFYAPNDGKKYDYVKVTYTSGGDMDGYTFGSDISNGGKGQSGNGQKKDKVLAAASVQRTVEYQATDQHVGGCLKAIKFVNMGASTDLHIESVKFLATKMEFSADTATKADWFFVDPSGNQYNEDGSVSFVLPKDGNKAIAFYFNKDKTPLDMSDYSEAEIVLVSDTANVSARGGFSIAENCSLDDKRDPIKNVTIGTTETKLTIKMSEVPSDANGYGFILQHCGWNDSPASPTITIKSIKLIPKVLPATTPVDLSGVTAAGSGDYISYDSTRKCLTVNDGRTGGNDTTELYCPLPEGLEVAPGQKLKVTISGSSWGTKDFRIWTTPNDEKSSGNYVANNSIYLAPAVSEGDSFTGTVVLTAKDKKCGNITLKPGHGQKIQNLVITDIKVDLVSE